jgi:RNA polymerase primary sigma factor/RNA polymerase sigma factor
MDSSISLKKKKSKKRKEAEKKLEVFLSRIFIHEDFLDAKKTQDILGDMPDLANYTKKEKEVIRKQVDVSSSFRPLYTAPLLTKIQEQHLFRLYNYHKYVAKNYLDRKKIKLALKEFEKANLIKSKIVCANLRLAIPTVRRYQNNKNYEDILSESYVLICKVVDFFDWTRNLKFSTYATWSMIRNLSREAGKMIKHDVRNVLIDDLKEDDDDSMIEPSCVNSVLHDRLQRDHCVHLVKRFLTFCSSSCEEIFNFLHQTREKSACFALLKK